ncbi:MAG TPA: LytTR family DNA-binding domain-containing protein [Ferruginibacter sp.]|nr:LytTR family DNA-binding domain-containing protein [Ferruginibacter sp.]HPH90435.1 LytTR family DNA-binding domain-containing protein [Ferruginibacter sp.]
MIKALLVDDKQPSIELLKYLLQQHCPEINDIATANSVREALQLVKNFQPDILFLDIQMPQQSGFDLLNAVDNWTFEVIFTTAYNEFAIQAIRFSALDYLLKPVDAGELVKAVDRYKAKRLYAPAGGELYKNFIQNISSQNRKLALPGTSTIKYVGLDEIIRLQAERNYTKLFFTNGKSFTAAKTLKEYEEVLSSSGSFIRVHRMHLVNYNFIKEYDREGLLHLKDGSSVEVSRRKKESLLRFLKR